MSAGEVTVSLTSGSLPMHVLVQPGMTHRVRLVGLVDGQQRMLDVDVSVIGQPCPDPSEHARLCAEGDHDRYGDCDGTVRLYVARQPVGGVNAGAEILFCSAHAQIHGRHIRKADR